MDGDDKSYQQIANDLHKIHTENIPMPTYYDHPQPQPTIAAPQAPPQNSYVQVQPPAMPIMPLAIGPNPMEMTCPHCRCRIRTRLNHRSTTKTHIVCLLLTWTLICCCLPYCMDSCRNTNHFCPMCGAYIGTYSS